MTEPVRRTGWAKYRLPLLLAAIAIGLYIMSILWIVYGRGQVV